MFHIFISVDLYVPMNLSHLLCHIIICYICLFLVLQSCCLSCYLFIFNCSVSLYAYRIYMIYMIHMLCVLMIHIVMDIFEITISMVNYLLYVIIIMLIYGIKIIRKMTIIQTYFICLGWWCHFCSHILPMSLFFGLLWRKLLNSH
jgi:hypothetical protein